MISSGRNHAAEAEKEILAAFAGPEVLDSAVVWAISHLEGEGIDPGRTGRRAATSLRSARPELSRIAARYLARRAAGGGPAASGPRPSPLLH